MQAQARTAPVALKQTPHVARFPLAANSSSTSEDHGMDTAALRRLPSRTARHERNSVDAATATSPRRSQRLSSRTQHAKLEPHRRQDRGFPFLELPTEVRLRIYELFYLSSRSPDALKLGLRLRDASSVRIRALYWPLDCPWHGGHKDPAHRDRLQGVRESDWFGSRAMTPLLRTNKQICREAAHVLYSDFTFEFLDGPFYLPALVEDLLDPVLPRIAAKNRRLIHKIRALVWLTRASNAPGQHEGVARLVQLLPNLRVVTLLPQMEWHQHQPGANTQPSLEFFVTETLKIFEPFGRANEWRVEYLDVGPDMWYAWKYRWCVVPPEYREALDDALRERNRAVAIERAGYVEEIEDCGLEDDEVEDLAKELETKHADCAGQKRCVLRSKEKRHRVL